MADFNRFEENKSPEYRKLRNLRQYKNLSDEDFDKMFKLHEVGVAPTKEFEGRIESKIKDFGKDYDLDDLNSNDMLVLRALAQALVSQEDYEIILYNLRKDGVSLDNILMIEKISAMLSDLRRDISKLQDDLKITRRVRKTDKAVSVREELDELKRKAKEFYESRMSYIFCPKCGQLLGTIWTLYPTEVRNKVHLICNSKNEDGTVCGEKVSVGTKELLDLGGTNTKNIPESMR